MRHKEITESIESELEEWLKKEGRSTKNKNPDLLDLGCGDLGKLDSILRKFPLNSYTGLDRTSEVLDKAASNLGEVPYPCHWICGEIRTWASTSKNRLQTNVDILHASFSLHHLQDVEKKEFLEQARQQISDNGIFLWVDVFQDDNDTRDSYLDRYIKRVRCWPGFTEEQRQYIISHITRFDIPAKKEWLERTASKSGWKLHWGWQKSQYAEALAVLTPSSTQK